MRYHLPPAPTCNALKIIQDCKTSRLTNLQNKNKTDPYRFTYFSFQFSISTLPTPHAIPYHHTPLLTILSFALHHSPSRHPFISSSHDFSRTCMHHFHDMCAVFQAFLISGPRLLTRLLNRLLVTGGLRVRKSPQQRARGVYSIHGCIVIMAFGGEPYETSTFRTRSSACISQTQKPTCQLLQNPITLAFLFFPSIPLVPLDSLDSTSRSLHYRGALHSNRCSNLPLVATSCDLVIHPPIRWWSS
jgi:hypothetical protein